MKTYAYQLDIQWEKKEDNFRKIIELTELHQPDKGSLIILPEMFATGFSMNTEITKEKEDGPSANFLKKFASETGCYVIGGMTQTKAIGKPTNDALLISPDERRIGEYSKIHPFSLGKEDEHYADGNKVFTFELPNGFRICPFICYDLRFPEIFRIAMQSDQPPHLFVVIANWPNRRTEHWVRLLEARAIENLAYVAGINRCGSDPYLDYDGSSMIIDPSGKVLADAQKSEGIISSELNLETVREWRSQFPALRDKRTMCALQPKRK